MSYVTSQATSDSECVSRSKSLDQQMRFLWVPGRRKKLAVESFALGQDCRSNGNAALAETNFRRVQALFHDEQPTKSKESLVIFALIAASHNHIGLLCLDSERLMDARPFFDRAIEIRRELHGLFPDDRENQVYLAACLA